MDNKPNNNQNRPNNRFQGNRPGGGGQGYGRRPQYQDATPSEFFEKVVQVNRVSKKNAGGNVMSLSVLAVVGNKKGKVGVGLGKASDVQSAVRKATTYAKKHLIEVPLKENRTIPHDIYVKLGAAKVLLKSAPQGTGVIAGGAVRVVVEAAGIHDVVSKTLGTSNKASNVYATLEALKRLKVRNSMGKIELSEKKEEVLVKEPKEKKAVKKGKKDESK